MTVLEALVQLRNDLKTWVTNNLNALNSKIEANTVPIDSELSKESKNPVQNKVVSENIQTLHDLIGEDSVSSQISEAIEDLSTFSGDYNDLINAPDIIEDKSGDLIITDEKGNIIFKADKDGIHSTSLQLQGENIKSTLEQKVDKVEGKGLSSNDYTDADKAKLSLLSNDMVSASIDSELSLTSDNPVKNKAIAEAFYKIDYKQLINAPEITEDQSDNVVIADFNDNIILKVDKNGVETTDVKAKQVIINGSNVLDSINNNQNNITTLTGTVANLNTSLSNLDTSLTNLDTSLTNLSGLVGNKSVQSQITEAINNNPSFSGEYQDLINAPDITENNSSDVIFVDDDGNIIARIDKNGIHSSNVFVNGDNILTRVERGLENLSTNVLKQNRLKVGLVPTGSRINENEDLNVIDYLSVNTYYCNLNKVASTLVNCPTEYAFIMSVYSPLTSKIDNETTSAWVYRIRKITDYQGNEWIQSVHSSGEAGVYTYKEWQPIIKEKDLNKYLQTKLSNQPTNIEFNQKGELRGSGGFIDFHYQVSDSDVVITKDYTSKIAENSEGILSINNVEFDISNNSVHAANIKIDNAETWTFVLADGTTINKSMVVSL